MKSFFERRSAVIGQNFSDGRWHKVQVNVTSGNVMIRVDTFQTVLAPPSGSQSTTDLGDNLYMGGLLNQLSPLGLTLNNKFLAFSGCSRSVTINEQEITFDTAQKSGGFPLPKSSCKKDENCAPSSCANEGMCDATWTGFECRCLNDFVGSQCQNGKEVVVNRKRIVYLCFLAKGAMDVRN